MKFSTTPVRFGTIGDLALELRKALTAIAAGWNVEHNPDGTHKESVSGVRLHAPTHNVGGTDPVTVTSLAGYPGGSTTFLRADHTFAAPTGTTPAAHATTHQDGGSDEVALDASQITTGTLADARLSSNVALENITNTFTAAQFINSDLVIGQNAPGIIYWKRPGMPADQQKWQEHGSFYTDGSYRFIPTTDAEAFIGAGIMFTRDSGVAVGGTIRERGRTTPMGEWTDVPFSAANFGGFGGGVYTVSVAPSVNHYTLIGKTILWNISVSGTYSGTPTPYLLLTIPGGYTGRVGNDGVQTIVCLEVSSPVSATAANWVAAGTQVIVIKQGGTNFAAGTVAAHFSIQFEIS